jgi:phage terminase large subunit GpA-like protein
MLRAGRHAIPGRLSHEFAPWARGLSDIPARPGVAELIVMKAGQMAGSEAIRTFCGWSIDQDPMPLAYVLPSKDKLQEVFNDDLIPMVEDTAPLAALQSSRARDTNSHLIRFVNNVILQGIWAGSAISLASHPFGRVFLDEVDKYPSYAGEEADPIGQARARLRSYGKRALLVLVSTPTVPFGYIASEFEAAPYKVYFLVPCPRCGARIRLDFSQLKWTDQGTKDRKERAAKLKASGECWYECQTCQGRIDDWERRSMVQAGRWATEDGTIPDAEAVERWPDGTKIAFQLSALYCIWPGFRWADVAAQYIESLGDRERMFNFRTLTLGLPYEEQQAHIPRNVFAQLAASAALPQGVIPRWASTLVASIDTQADHFYLTIRAYGPWPRSQRVYHRVVRTFEELDQLCYHTAWRVEADAFRPQRCALTIIDTGGTDAGEGSRTMQVYAWSMKRRWVVPVKGRGRQTSGPTVLLMPGKGWIDRGRTRKTSKSIPIYLYDKTMAHDLLADLITAGPEVWSLDATPDSVYEEQMANLVKVPRYRGPRLTFEWVEQTPGARHDYRDCEMMSVLGAYLLGLEQQTEEGVRQFQASQPVQSPGSPARPEAPPPPIRPRSWADVMR